MTKSKKVVVVAPTFNEKASIEKVVKLIIAQDGKVPNFNIHVLIVDSHSPDGTGEIAKQLTKKDHRIHFLDVTERGLGLAIVSGYQYALKELKADVLMQIDADLQHDPTEIPLFLEKIQQGYDYVQGSRYVTGGENKISFTRRVFSYGASMICRLLTGVWQITDFMPSYKAYTRELFLKMNWNAIPWQGTTFLIQPAAVVEAYRAGAKIAEVPIKFRNRHADRSKNETLNYIIDVIGYGLEVRFAIWGLNVPVLQWFRKSKLFLKFGAVGLIGTVIDFVIYKFLIAKFGFPAPRARLISIPLAVQSNFSLNNLWTFKHRKTKNALWQRWLLFNLVSLGGWVIGYGVTLALHAVYGQGLIHLGYATVAYDDIYFVITIPPMMTWNFLMNHFITWKSHPDK